MTEQSTICEPLLALATPQLYHRNLFRVLNLPVNATPKDVQRQQNRRKMQQKLGITASDDQGGLFPLDPLPSEEDIRLAMERLNKPVERLLDEALWFWPINGGVATDPALKALEQGQIAKATALWKEQTKLNGRGQIATHNLAVLDLLVALDREVSLASQKTDKKHLKELTDLWFRAYTRWEQVLDGEEFWSAMKNRIRDLNDLQLTTGFVRRIRSTLPKALLLINVRIALSAAESGDIKLAERHIQFVSQTNFGKDLADEAILEALKPIRNRIKTATNKAKDQWTSTPQHGNRDVRELCGQTEGLLGIVDVVLPEENLTRANLHDMVAETMLEGQVAFGNKTNDWQQCIDLLKIAQKVAVGLSTQTKLSENIETLKENDECGNDWCSPGYWDLPEENIVELEAAQQKLQAGDYNGAIQSLVVLDPKIRKPLHRCLANALSLKGISICNNALTEYNKDTGILKKIVNNIVKYQNSSWDAPSQWGVFPSPDMYSTPPCLCCKGTYYTSWINFTYNDNQLFMCSSCSAEQDRELEQQKVILRQYLKTALEYLLLAAEVDPGDVGVQRNLKTVKKTAKNIDCRSPNTKELKKNLGTGLVRNTPYTFELTEADQVCHFCHENKANDSCRISIPMCGDLQEFDAMFGKGLEYCYTDVVVPRCRRCRDEHRELFGRIEKWHEAKLAAADIKYFLELEKEIEAAKISVSQAQERVGEHKKKVDEIQSEMEQAKAIGSKCDRCHSEKLWKDYLCLNCDQKAFKMYFAVGMAFVLPMAIILILQDKFSILNRLTEFVPVHSNFGRAGSIDHPAIYMLTLAIGGPLSFFITRGHRSRRRSLSKQRQMEITQRRNNAIAKAQVRMEQAIASLNSVEDKAKIPIRAHEEAKKNLELAKKNAIAEFVRINPEPNLTSGVKPESIYEEFTRIRDLSNDGWGFGHELQKDGKSVSKSPIDPQGLVGHHLITEPCTSDYSFSRLTKGRDRLKEIAKQAADDEMTGCPICGTRLKAKNLVRHYDKQHKGHPIVTNDIENRVLCIDGGCIGAVGDDGHCKECGTPHPDFT